MHTICLAIFSSCNHWETTISSGASTSSLSCIDISKGSNKVVASSTMAESTQCQERLKENKPIGIPKLRKRLVHLS